MKHKFAICFNFSVALANIVSFFSCLETIMTNPNNLPSYHTAMLGFTMTINITFGVAACLVAIDLSRTRKEY